MSRDLELALETTTRQSSVTLGRGDDILETIDLPAQRRHNVALMPALDALLDRHNATPADLALLHVSVGPGSFTGLRYRQGAFARHRLPHHRRADARCPGQPRS